MLKYIIVTAQAVVKAANARAALVAGFHPVKDFFVGIYSVTRGILFGFGAFFVRGGALV